MSSNYQVKPSTTSQHEVAPLGIPYYEVNSQKYDTNRLNLKSIPDEFTQNVFSESNELETGRVKPKTVEYISNTEEYDQNYYLNLLKLMRMARYSILIVCFSDIAILFTSLCLFSIYMGFKGLKEIKIWCLVIYLIFLKISILPYIIVSNMFRRDEITILCSIISFLKLISMIIVIIVSFRFGRVGPGMKSRLIIDYNAFPGNHCFCC